MHETHALTHSPLPTLSLLATAHETQLRIAINLEIHPELTTTNIPKPPLGLHQEQIPTIRIYCP